MEGLNFRMSEFTAALGLVQTERMPEIVAWKNAVAREHLDPVHHATARASCRDDVRACTSTSCSTRSSGRPGKVYDQPCHRLMGHHAELPNSDWVAEHHWCVPLYYSPDKEVASQ